MSNSQDRRKVRRSTPLPGTIRRRLQLERLCDRRVLATVTGMVFEDADASSSFEQSEQGLNDRLVYLDINNDGLPGVGEPIERTDATGRFEFDQLTLGDYVVRLFNGTQSQRQTLPVLPKLNEDLLQIADVNVLGTSPDGAAVFGLKDQSLLRIDHQTGEVVPLDLGGTASSVHALPDGRLLVLGDADVVQSPSAWIASFSDQAVTPIDFGLAPSETGWASAAINQDGNGVLIGRSINGSPTVLRQLSFQSGQLFATPTNYSLADGATALTSADGSRTLVAAPRDGGLELTLWSNSIGQPILGSTHLIAGGESLAAFDDESGLAVVRNSSGDLLVLDADNDYALLNRIEGLVSPVTLDGVKEWLFGRDAESNLVIYDIAASTTRAIVPIALPRSGGMALVDDGRSLLLGGDYAILRVNLDFVAGHNVELRQGQESADVLFGLYVEEANASPLFDGEYTYFLEEDTTLRRSAPALLNAASDIDAEDVFVVLPASDPVAGTATVGPLGSLVYRPAPDYFGQDQFDIQLHDGRSAADTTTVRLNVAPVNDPLGPWVVDLPPVLENIAPGEPLGAVTIVNVDIGEIVDILVDDPRFIIENGHLILVEGVELDFETESEIQLQVTASDSLDSVPQTATLVLQVLDVNEPVIGIEMVNRFDFYENAFGAVTIGQLSVIDEDYTGEYTFTVDDERFEVVDSELRVKPELVLDHETDDGMTVEVTVFDGPFQASQEFVIEVLDVNEEPTAIGFAAETILERVAGVSVGEMEVDDPDQPTNTQLSVDDSRFEFVGTTLKLRDGVSVSYAEQQQIQLTLSGVDGGFSDSLVVVLEVLPNDYPFHNENYPADVDGNGRAEAIDAMMIINYLNRHGPGPIEQAIASGAELYYDVNADGLVTPLDALLVINRINRENRTGTPGTVGGDSKSPQGEAASAEDVVSDQATDGDALGDGLEPKMTGGFEPRAAVIDQAVQGYFVVDGSRDDEDEEDEGFWML